MKASELIKALQLMIDEHGDLEVFSTADWDYVRGVEFTSGDVMRSKQDVITLES